MDDYVCRLTLSLQSWLFFYYPSWNKTLHVTVRNNNTKLE